jgi:hypothetical protein
MIGLNYMFIMKKLFYLSIITICFCICSCSSSYYGYNTTIGDIILLSNNGKAIGEWKNATLQIESEYGYNSGTPLKNGGLHFNTSNGETMYISGGILIVKNITSKELLNKSLKETYSQQEYSYNEPDKLKMEYKRIGDEIRLNKKEMKLLSKDDPLYHKLKDQNKILKLKLKSIEDEYLELTGRVIYE